MLKKLPRLLPGLPFSKLLRSFFLLYYREEYHIDVWYVATLHTNIRHTEYDMRIEVKG